MKKLLLFVLLIVYVSSVNEDPVLEGVDWKNVWEKVKKTYNDAINFLKDNDLYDPLLDLIKRLGKQAGVNWCKGDRKIPEDTCISIVNWLVDHFKL